MTKLLTAKIIVLFENAAQNFRMLFCCDGCRRFFRHVTNCTTALQCRTASALLHSAWTCTAVRQTARQPTGVVCQVRVAIVTAAAATAGAAAGRCSPELSWTRWRSDSSGSRSWRAKNASNSPMKSNSLNDRSSSGFKIDGMITPSVI